jgi:hypothetical protein
MRDLYKAHRANFNHPYLGSLRLGKNLTSGDQNYAGQIHVTLLRGRARPLVTEGHYLVGDVVREKVSQQPKQGQSRNAVCSKNPGAAAFVFTGK